MKIVLIVFLYQEIISKSLIEKELFLFPRSVVLVVRSRRVFIVVRFRIGLWERIPCRGLRSCKFLMLLMSLMLLRKEQQESPPKERELEALNKLFLVAIVVPLNVPVVLTAVFLVASCLIKVFYSGSSIYLPLRRYSRHSLLLNLNILGLITKEFIRTFLKLNMKNIIKKIIENLIFILKLYY